MDQISEDSVDRLVAHWARELDAFDPVKEAIVMRLAVIGRHLTQARRAALDAGGLKKWQFKVLLMLRRQGPPYTASPSQLADFLALTRGALSARLAPLEEAGLITRVSDGGDRRRVHVGLTPEGNKALEEQLAGEDERETDMLAGLDEDERRTLAALLRTVVRAVESGGSPQAPCAQEA